MSSPHASPRVVIADPDIDLAQARRNLAGLDVTVEPARVGWPSPGVLAAIVTPVLQVGPTELSACPDLGLVITTSTGYDNIDIEACRARGVGVWHPRDYCSDEVADTALTLLLALLRGTVTLDRAVRAGGWHFAAAGELHRLDRTRLGIVGFGTIGRKVAARAQALGMTVAAYDPVQPANALRAAGVDPVTLDELFRTCTAVSIHAPLTPSTRGLVSDRLLSLMPPGAVLVNVARGAIVDTAALLRHLESGQLAGAALDVLETEPPSGAAPAPVHDRLIVTPHAAWYSAQSAHTLFITPLEVVRDYLDAQPRSDYECPPAQPAPSTTRVE